MTVVLVRWQLRWQRWKQDGLFYWVIPIIVLIVCLLLFALAEVNMKNTIMAIAEAKSREMATQAINNAILNRVSNDANFRDLVYYKTDQEGRIVLLQPNTLRINQLTSETVLEVQQSLSNLDQLEIAVPLGQMLGSSLLANVGPKVRIHITPVGSVKAKPVESFEEAGINQTKYMVALDIESAIRIVVPLMSTEVPINTRVPISTSIISGSVPNVYLRGSSALSPTIDVGTEKK
nr:sporulation protein YunB [Heliobacterium chlorum]